MYGDIVESVGVRELKARLSEYLKRVQAGQCLTVTDRGRAIATIQPVAQIQSIQWVRDMVADGRASWRGGKPAGLAARVSSHGRSASSIVIGDRR